MIKREWLFFGKSIIFEIANIRNMNDMEEISLKQLNILQKIIKTNDIEWKDPITDELAIKLEKIRRMNLDFMEYHNTNDEIDYLLNYFENDNKFISLFYEWYNENEMDRDSLIEDIGSDRDKNQSNFIIF